MTLCPSCGEPNPARASFCLACGTPLPSPDEAVRPARKTVTVVFTDVAESGGLGERLDPESLSLVMASWFDHMRALFERHGARVQKFVGDAVVAVFGIPAVNEDDALRAVRAAAELQASVDELNERLERDWGVRLRARSGVNTGEVVTGDPAIGDALVLGDAVNVAARLEQAASPGEVLLGQPTLRLVHDAVEVEPVPPLRLKGKQAPVAAWRLLGVAPGAPGHARRQDAPIVGRQPELRLFEWVYERVSTTAACHLLTVLGQAGVGKTRLVAEAVRGLEATVLRGRCLSYGEGITFWPVSEVVHQAARMIDTDSPTEAAAKLRRLLGDAGDADHVAGRVAQLIGLEATPVPAEEAAWAFRRLLEVLAGRGPLVVVLDDLHWAEPTLLDLVEHVADFARAAPILLVAIARPELLEQRPGWAGGKLNATTVLLEPLGEAESEELLDSLAGPAALPEAARRGITRAAEGNPLFLEELLAALVEEGRLRREDGRWVAAADLATLGIPPSIQALLTARLDRLDGADRAILERASVVGQVFERSAVVELSPPERRHEIPGRLGTLVRRELLRRVPSRLAGDEGFQFRHQLLRDAAYDSIPKQTRAELHERFAGWLERTAGPRLREVEEILGYHLERAWGYQVELGTATDGDRRLAEAAAARLGGAGRRAMARGDLPAAANLLERAIALLPEGSGEPQRGAPDDREPGDPGRRELLVELADVLVTTGEFTRAAAAIAAVTALAGGDAHLAAHATVARLRMQVAVATDLDADALQAEARRAIATFAAAADEHGLAKAYGLLAQLGFLRCRIAEAETAAAEAIGHARLAGDEPTEGWARGMLAQAAFWGPVPVGDGIRRCRALLEQAGGNRRAEVAALQSLAGLQAMAGEAEQAMATADRAVARAEDLGANRQAALARVFAAAAAMLAGDPAAAERHLRWAIRVVERQGDTGLRSNLTADLAHVLHELGHGEEALRQAMASHALAAREDLFAQVRWRGAAAKALAGEGRLEEAARLAAEAVRLAAPTDMLTMRGDALLDQATVALAAGRDGDAAAAAHAALELYLAKGNRPGAARARAVAAATRQATSTRAGDA
jgi:class 3 adenylate cyclase